MMIMMIDDDNDDDDDDYDDVDDDDIRSKLILRLLFQSTAVPFGVVWKAAKCLILHFQPLPWQDRKMALNERG